MNDLGTKFGEENLNAMSEQELTEYCKCKGLNNVEIAIVVNKVVHKRKNVDIMPIIGYEKTRFYEIRHEIINKGVNISKK